MSSEEETSDMGSGSVKAASQEEVNGLVADLSPEARAKLIAAVDSQFSKCRYEKSKVSVKGKQMAYLEAGTGDPIVFLHGNPTSSYMWRNVIPYCEKLGRVIAPDLIGMGDSDKLDDPATYSVLVQAQYLEGFLEALGIKENVTFVVHSWGGVLGADWAARHKDAMKGFVLMESPLDPDASKHFPEQMKGAFKMMKSEKGEEMVLQHNIMIENTIPGGVMRTLSKEEHDEYRRPFVEPGASRRAIYAFVSSVPVDGEPAEVYKMQSDSLTWMKTTKMPVLLIRGNPGSSTTAEEVEIVRSFQNVTDEEVKGKHLLTEDSPREIGNAIAKWYCAITSKM